MAMRKDEKSDLKLVLCSKESFGDDFFSSRIERWTLRATVIKLAGVFMEGKQIIKILNTLR